MYLGMNSPDIAYTEVTMKSCISGNYTWFIVVVAYTLVGSEVVARMPVCWRCICTACMLNERHQRHLVMVDAGTSRYKDTI